MSPIEYIAGRVEDRGLDWVVIDLQGMGWRVNVPLGTAAALAQGAAAKLWCHLYVREDTRALYGFAIAAERALFLQLLGVTGVGPRTALAALSMLGADRLAAAIESGDETTLARVQGVGRRTAQRMVLDLKGKVRFIGEGVAVPAGDDDVLDALVGTGFTRSEAAAVLATLPLDPTRSVEATLLLAFQAHGARNSAGNARAEGGPHPQPLSQ